MQNNGYETGRLDLPFVGTGLPRLGQDRRRCSDPRHAQRQAPVPVSGLVAFMRHRRRSRLVTQALTTMRMTFST